MAYFEPVLTQNSRGWRALLSRLFETPFDRRMQSLKDELSKLRALSDAELAELGISRDDILGHVFRARSGR